MAYLFITNTASRIKKDKCDEKEQQTKRKSKRKTFRFSKSRNGVKETWHVTKETKLKEKQKKKMESLNMKIEFFIFTGITTM